MSEDPTKSHGSNDTEVWISFAFGSVFVQREEEAFSFTSLVADCGGILGLFIGFNFLMVWDWLVEMMTSVLPKIFFAFLKCTRK